MKIILLILTDRYGINTFDNNINYNEIKYKNKIHFYNDILNKNKKEISNEKIIKLE